MNSDGGTTYRVVIADGPDTSDDETAKSTLEDRNVDAFELDVTIGCVEAGKIAFVNKIKILAYLKNQVPTMRLKGHRSILQESME